MTRRASCSCRLGTIVRTLGRDPRPSPNKRGWQFVASAFLFLFAYFFYLVLTRNSDGHGLVALTIFGFFGIATLMAGVLSAIVGFVGCEHCVSRM
jgi:hypothetical protein